MRILTDADQKHTVAKEAIERLLWSLDLHLGVLAETENNPVYLEKRTQIRNILIDSLIS